MEQQGLGIQVQQQVVGVQQEQSQLVEVQVAGVEAIGKLSRLVSAERQDVQQVEQKVLEWSAELKLRRCWTIGASRRCRRS